MNKAVLTVVLISAGMLSWYYFSSVELPPAERGDTSQVSKPVPDEVEGFRPTPKVDARGWIDVWQLRQDVAQVEPWFATDDTDGCHDEGDSDFEAEESIQPTEEELRKAESIRMEEEQKTKECEQDIHERYAKYKRRYDVFNAAWLPVLQRAVKKGDKVAEVILLRCDTTPVIDRRGLDSTCDPASRSRALERLKRIGFRPAIDIESMPGYCRYPSGCNDSYRDVQDRAALQFLVMDAFHFGNFGSIPPAALGNSGEVPTDPAGFSEAQAKPSFTMRLKLKIDRRTVVSDRFDGY
jgi:hypothetical protein